MPRRVAIKNHVHEIRLISRRSIAVLVIMIILIALLITRLAYLQLSSHDLYITLSKKNWLDLIPLEPTRGLIYDRNGVLLSENLPVYSLDAIPSKIANFPKTLADIIKVVPLNDNDISQFQKQLKQHRRFDEVTIKLRLNENEVARFAENQYRIPGVFVKARLIRHYPFGDNLTHLLGYVGRISLDELTDIDTSNYSATEYIGKLGIEKYYEDELHGTVGYEQAETDASGEPVRVINQIDPLPGKNLFLTVDTKLQMFAESVLGGHRGAIVVIQPSTGQILALVSKPSYDPNLFVEGISSQDYKALQLSPDRPLYNRAVRGLYPPASTIKPFIAIEGLDSGVIDTAHTIFDPGWYQLPNSTHIFHDWKRHGHGVVNISRAIISSCDVFFFDLAHRLGIQRIDYMLDQFGFGKPTGIDIDEELNGLVPSPAWKLKNRKQGWYPGDTIISGIGQGFMQVTALQLATAVATIANKGVKVTPHLLLAVQEANKSPELQNPSRVPPIKLNNPNNWNIVRQAMEGVIISPYGTGKKHFGKVGPYSVAGKTGTAQVHNIKNYNSNEDHENQENLPEKLRDNSLFMAFAPFDKPQVAIAVIEENDSNAAGIARQILDYFFLGPPPPQREDTNAITPKSQKANENPVDINLDSDETDIDH